MFATTTTTLRGSPTPPPPPPPPPDAYTLHADFCSPSHMAHSMYSKFCGTYTHTHDCGGHPVYVKKVCSDSATFVDENGDSCEDWQGYNCRDGLTQAGQVSLQQRCRAACDMCSPHTYLQADGGGEVVLYRDAESSYWRLAPHRCLQYCGDDNHVCNVSPSAGFENSGGSPLGRWHAPVFAGHLFLEAE